MPEIQPDPSPAALARAIEDNGVECCLSWASWSGMTLTRDRWCDWTITDVPFAFFNNVFRARIPRKEVDAEIRRLQDAARRRNVPLFWWTGDSTRPEDLPTSLQQHGFLPVFSAPAMAARLSPSLHEDIPPAGLLIREVQNHDQLAAWVTAMAEVYEFPEFAITPWRDILCGQPFGPQSRFLAEVDGEVIGTASLYFAAGVAGLSSVGIREAFRSRGYGTALTRSVMAVAARHDCSTVVLYSSPQAENIYRKLGFHHYGRGNCFLWDPSDTASSASPEPSGTLPTAHSSTRNSPPKTPPPE